MVKKILKKTKTKRNKLTENFNVKKIKKITINKRRIIYKLFKK